MIAQASLRGLVRRNLQSSTDDSRLQDSLRLLDPFIVHVSDWSLEFWWFDRPLLAGWNVGLWIWPPLFRAPERHQDYLFLWHFSQYTKYSSKYFRETNVNVVYIIQFFSVIVPTFGSISTTYQTQAKWHQYNIWTVLFKHSKKYLHRKTYQKELLGTRNILRRGDTDKSIGFKWYRTIPEDWLVLILGLVTKGYLLGSENFFWLANKM